MKTPAELASSQMAAFTIAEGSQDDGERGDVVECSVEYIEAQIIAAIEADRAQHRELLEREANILDSYRRGLADRKVPEATEHNMSRASEAMRLVAGWEAGEACRVSFS